MKKRLIVNNESFLNTNILQIILSRRLTFYSVLKWLLCLILTLLCIFNAIQNYISYKQHLSILTNSFPKWVINLLEHEKLKPFIQNMRHSELALIIIFFINFLFAYRARKLKKQIKQIWNNSNKAEVLVNKHYLQACFKNIELNLVIFLYIFSAFMTMISVIFLYKETKIKIYDYEIDNWLFYIYFFSILFCLSFLLHCFCFFWNKKTKTMLWLYYKDVLPDEALVTKYISKRYTKFLITLLIFILIIPTLLLFLLIFFKFI